MAGDSELRARFVAGNEPEAFNKAVTSIVVGFCSQPSTKHLFSRSAENVDAVVVVSSREMLK